MALFRKKPQPTPEAVNAPEAINLAANRLGPVFNQMYLWILSVNLNRNVYQMECGTPEFAGQPIPVRGQWSKLVAQFADAVYPEHRLRIEESFSINHLTSVFSSGKSRVSTIVYYDTEDETGAHCVQIWMERIPQKNSRDFTTIVYGRLIENEDDTGNTYHAPHPVEKTADDEIDWDAVWLRRMLGNDSPRYEYDVANDTFYLHTGMSDNRRNRSWTRFLGSLESRSDVFFSHDSVSILRDLLMKGLQGESGTAFIGIRMGVNQAAPIEHYEINCHPLEECGSPSWLFGSLRNVEKQYHRQKQIQDIALDMGIAFEQAFEGLYSIDTKKNTIQSLIRSENGYVFSSSTRSYSAYLNHQIDNGVVAPESTANVQKLLQKGFLDKKAAHQVFEMDFRLKLPGKLDYTWYVDSFIPIENKPHRYLLTRRDVSAIYAARQREFDYAESQRLAQYNQSMLDTLAGLVEFRNVESGAHIAHVREIAHVLMKDLARRSPQYNMTPQMIDLYTHAATMHDVGKITIPDAILNKAGPLTPEEFDQMKLHTVKGTQIISKLNLPGQEELKECCSQVALHHHERWDGSGYPDGLVGEQNNIYCQAIGLADVVDALLSRRCYKNSIPFEQAVKMICNGECGAFNPRVIESFVQCQDAIRAFYEKELPQQEKVEVTNGQ